MSIMMVKVRVKRIYMVKKKTTRATSTMTAKKMIGLFFFSFISHP